MEDPQAPERGSAVALAAASLLVLVVYVAVLSQMPLDVFWHPDEGAKYITVHTLRWDDGLEIRLPYRGEGLDPERRFYPADPIYPQVAEDGSVRFRWPILFPLLTRPFVDTFGLPGIYVLPLLAGWLTAVLAGIWTRRFLPRGAPLAVLLAGLATPVAFYSVSFLEHTLAALLTGVAATALVLRPGRLSALALMAPPLLAAVALRIEALAFAGAAAGAWAVAALFRLRWEPPSLLRSSRSVWMALLALAIVLPLGYLALVTIVHERHLDLLRRIPDGVAMLWVRRGFLFDSIVHVFLGELPLGGHQLARVWQVVALLSLGALVAAPFADNRRTEALLALPALLVVLQVSLLTVMISLPFLQRQGILAVAPFTAIALFALPEAFRRRDTRLLALASLSLLATVLGFLALFVTRVTANEGRSLLGLDGAVRYLLWLYPVGAAVSVIALAAYRQSDAPRWARSLFTVLVASLMLVSFYYEALGVQELRAKREVLVHWRAEIDRPRPVVTDIWWLPAVLAPYWLAHELYHVDGQEELGEWIAAARERGVADFTLATSAQRARPALAPGSGAEALESNEVFGFLVTPVRILPEAESQE